MIVLDAHLQFAFAELGFETLAGVGLRGVADRVAALIQQNAVTTAEGRQWADHMQRLHLAVQLQSTILQTFAHGPGQAFGEAVEALAQHRQLASRMLPGEAGFQADQAFAAGIEAALEGAAQAHVQVVQALGLLAQAFAGVASACLRDGDVLVVWQLDRLGRSRAHLVNTVKELSDRKIGLRVLTGKGAQIDTTTASGRMVFGIFATLAEFERDLIRERTMAGLASARARGRKGGRKFALTKAQVRLAQAAMAQRDTSVSDLCKELGIERVTLYRYVGPKGELRDHGKHVLGLT